MTLRKLEPGESSRGIHNIEAVDKDGNVLARYECDCPWCDIWRGGGTDARRGNPQTRRERVRPNAGRRHHRHTGVTMAARYYTLVYRDLLAEIQNGTADMPDGFRLVRIVEAPTPNDTELCLFEDDHAHPDLNGLNVEPVFMREYDPKTGKPAAVHIIDRRVVERW